MLHTFNIMDWRQDELLNLGAEASLMNSAIPLAVLLCLCLMTFLLCITSSNAYYQIASRTLSAWAIFKNSLMLIFAMGWRSTVVGFLCMLFIVVMVHFYTIMVPVCTIFGLPVLHCTTMQAVIRSKLETFFREQSDRAD